MRCGAESRVQNWVQGLVQLDNWHFSVVCQLEVVLQVYEKLSTHTCEKCW